MDIYDDQIKYSSTKFKKKKRKKSTVLLKDQTGLIITLIQALGTF